MTELSILMPAFNERATVVEAIEQVLGVDLPLVSVEVIVVDDGSTDGTRELLMERDWPEPVRVLAHDRNEGKGAAVRTALGHARGTYATIMDADLEYEAADLPKLLEPLVSGQTDVVFGIRGFGSQSAFSFWYVMGNKTVTMATNVLFNAWLADIMTCCKAMRTSLLRSLDLRARGFAIEPEITAKLLASGYRIYEVPVRYRARTREEGKKLTALDGLLVLGTLLGWRLRTARLPRRAPGRA